MNRETFFRLGEEVSSEPYAYRAAGLDGIYLANGYTVEEHDGEKHVRIYDMEGLHQAIGRHLVLHRKALAPKEVKFLRNTLNLTQTELASHLGNNSQSVARWEKGECEIPGASEKLLRLVYLLMTMTDAEFEAVRDLVMNPEQLDELEARPVQFTHSDHWAEKAIRQAA